jgi:hypothetical protein
MEYQTVMNEENDGQEQTFSPYIQEDQHNDEKRKRKNLEEFLFNIYFRIKMESSKRFR